MSQHFIYTLYICSVRYCIDLLTYIYAYQTVGKAINYLHVCTVHQQYQNTIYYSN